MEGINVFFHRFLLFSFLLVVFVDISGQSAPNTYFIQFTDKNNTPFTVTSPSQFLSARAIQRRAKQNIPVTIQDLPVDLSYIDSVLSYDSTTLLCRSKWFNAITVSITDTNSLQQIQQLGFVSQVRLVRSTCRHINFFKPETEPERGNSYFLSGDIYGNAYNQIHMMNGEFLHHLGYRGENMLIAVLDAGFQSVPVMSCFSQAISQNRITGVYDFAQSENDVYNNSSTHGSLVLSCMAGNIEGEYVGTAPDANYQLYISEVAATEYLVEEDYWVSAAEMADSAGADVINTSLGYSLFDDTLMNHSYADMDGNSTRISIGTDIAVSKGMICVNSAGNSGNNSWFYITAPADADSVLTVGAVGPDRMYASFSSKGPSYDGRVKPNVATQGYQAQVYWPGNFSGAGSGTSFSSPIMAGLAACLWQAFPDKKNMEIVKAIEQSASQYNTPDSLTGYGIPDMRKAYYILDGNTNTEDEIEVILMQNLFDNYSWLQLYSSQAKQITLEIIDARGRKVHIYNVNLIAGEYNRLTLNGLMNILSPGMYFLNIKAEGYTKTEKFIKR